MTITSAIVGTGRSPTRTPRPSPTSATRRWSGRRPRPGARPGLRRAFSVPATYGSVAELLEQTQPDYVHICTPPGSHVPLAIEVLRGGAVPDHREAAGALPRRARPAARRRGRDRHPAIGLFQHRFGTGAEAPAPALAEGALGRPLVAVCETLWYRDADYFAVPWRGNWDIEGGGPTMGHGIHQFDLLLSMLGPWRRVRAVAGRQARDTETEDVSMALVTFENGAIATVVNSLVSPRQTSGCASTSSTRPSSSSTSTATRDALDLHPGAGPGGARRALDRSAPSAPERPRGPVRRRSPRPRRRHAAARDDHRRAPHPVARRRALRLGVHRRRRGGRHRPRAPVLRQHGGHRRTVGGGRRGSRSDDRDRTDGGHDDRPHPSPTSSTAASRAPRRRGARRVRLRARHRAARVPEAVLAPAAHPRRAPRQPVPPARPRLAQGHRLVAAARRPENFWGGPTFVRGQSYVQLENNGRAGTRNCSTAGGRRVRRDRASPGLDHPGRRAHHRGDAAPHAPPPRPTAAGC